MSDNDPAELSIERAAELFAEQGAVGNRTQQSVGTYMHGVNTLMRWCEEHGHATVINLTKLNVGGYNPWLADVDEWSNPYKESITCGARHFLRFLEKRGVVEGGEGRQSKVIT